MEDVELDDVVFDDVVYGVEEDDMVSYGDVTVRRSHVSPKPPQREAPVDRTGATAMIDLHMLTAPLQAFRSVFATEGVVADQLPSVEEYKVQAALGSGTHRRGIREMLKKSAYKSGSKAKGCTSAIRERVKNNGERLFMAAMIFFILLGMILFGSEKMRGDSSGDGATIEDGADLSGDVDRTYNERYTKVSGFIASQGWTSSYRLAEEGSPQMRAAVWLSDFDDDHVPVANTPAFRERYALAVLYFAASGRYWARDIDFMSDTNVCEWARDNIANTNGGITRIGVDCTCRHPTNENCGFKDPSTVKRLLLPSMNLEGELPHEIYLLYDLIELDLNSNKLSGEITQGVLLLRSLRILSLQHNRLEGELPSWIGDMVELRELNVASNRINGNLPEDLSKLTNLLMLNLSDNNLSGSLMPLKDVQQIEALFLADNQFQGPLRPHFVQWWPWLRILDLSDNLIGSTLPGNIFTHPTLRVLDLHGNKMSGSLPEVDRKCKIEFLALQDNSLGSSIPDSMNRLSNLYHLDLSKNELTGPIPASFSALQKLQSLFLAFNPFTEETIPHYLGSMTDLRNLSLQKTRRRGHIPPILGNLANLTLLDLGDNTLSGSIPTTLGTLSQLHYLILYRNYLTGALPEGLGSLDSLKKLIANQNDITERADYLCVPPSPQLTVVMECDKTPTSIYPYCPCCQCCIEEDVDCDSAVYFGGFDSAFETQFVRQHFTFHRNDVPYVAISP